eukprot:TRINITY_DN16543_c0_g1_i2.p1 TRINITY_DN16543_c0_g1~~TRINITY_DN16543_c0_g1_i2.p1  ORF type:complete len:283 (-),score=58.74 TRINITY_DN16543_c0_g1_i2:181-993(-)
MASSARIMCSRRGVSCLQANAPSIVAMALIPRPARFATAPAAASPEDTRLQVRANTEVGLVAGAIAHRVRQHGLATVRAIGAKATYHGLKAVICAGEYLQQDEGAAARNEVLALRVFEVTEAFGEKEEKRTVMHMEATHRKRGADKQRDGAPRSLIVGANTNAGKAAAAIASALRGTPNAGGSGGDGAATATSSTQGILRAADVRAMGAAAIHQALVSSVVAQQYLDTDGRGVKLVVVPRFEPYEDTGAVGAATKQPSSKRQLILGICRA